MNLFDYMNARAVRKSNVDYIIGRTQRNLSYYTLAIIGGTLFALFYTITSLSGPAAEIVKSLLLMLLGALIGVWSQQTNFWFGRPRGAGIPDPTTTTTSQTTQTTTLPTPNGAPNVIPTIQSPVIPPGTVLNH